MARPSYEARRTSHSDGNSTRSANSVPFAGATLTLPMLRPERAALRSKACASGRESTLSPEMKSKLDETQLKSSVMLAGGARRWRDGLSSGLPSGRRSGSSFSRSFSVLAVSGMRKVLPAISGSPRGVAAADLAFVLARRCLLLSFSAPLASRGVAATRGVPPRGVLEPPPPLSVATPPLRGVPATRGVPFSGVRPPVAAPPFFLPPPMGSR